MLERLMALPLRNRLVVALGVLLIVALGAYAVRSIPIDAFPDVTNVQVEVVSTATGMAPLEIEQFVTRPIENGMRGLPGLLTMRSVTKYGLSVITLVFGDDVDIYFARQQVHERLSGVERALPDGVETEMGPIATAMGEIYQYTLEGDPPAGPGGEVARLTRLRTIQDWVVAPLLKSVAGVTEINSFGGYLQQYHVVADPDALLAYGLSVDEVADAIRSNNANVGGGIVSQGPEQRIIRGVGLFRDEEDIRSVVLKAERGTPVTIREVGDVRAGHAVRQGASQMNGDREVVGGIVMMLRGENSREVSKNVEARVREINASRMLPDGLRIVPFHRRSEIVGASTRTVLKALVEGSVLVLAVLAVFLWSVRGALVVIAALPVSALLTFIAMRFAGLGANLMSLGGLAISVGMVIDATIIQVENIQRHLARHPPGPEKLRTVLRAALEVRKPSIFGELIIALTFVPIAAMQGMEGKMFSPLAYTVALALLSSLLLSIFVIPTLCLAVLEPVRRESPVFALARRLYLPWLSITLRRRRAVLGAAGAALIAALLLVPRLGTEFVPVMDEGAFDMDVQMIPGVSLEQAMQTAGEVEARLKRFPELETIVSRTGQTGVAIEARGVDKTGFVGTLLPRSRWTTARSRDELIARMRDSLADIPGMVFSFSQPIQCRIDELVAGTRAQVILKLFGDDADLLRRKAGELASVLGAVPGAADLVVERVSGQPYLAVTVDREKVARYGANAGDVLRVIEIAVAGKPLSRLYQQNRVFDIALRFPDERRGSVEALGALLVAVPGGYRVPLRELADVRAIEGPAQISRENGQRRIGLELNVVGRDIGGFVSEARRRIAERVELPPGYYLSWGGQFENQQQAMRRLAVITPVVAGLIFLLLLFTFDSVRLAALVLANLPFAMVGGVFALFLSGLYLSVPASVGFIVLFGVAVLNGVVLVSHISDLRDAGATVADAVRIGCEDRLRPVLMTASISILSLIPMVLATGPGSEVQRPLAVVVIGGLATSTALTLLVLPTLYQWLAPGRRTARS
ncbi:MAG TPA: CusA/CzcA family heavy metal efflux RND transporter [Vicinamibacterales bacterium]|nr:CusA/CzcA family heavy metal efflux RND transporter [Vicinamibacterales bacterium]